MQSISRARQDDESLSPIEWDAGRMQDLKDPYDSPTESLLSRPRFARRRPQRHNQHSSFSAIYSGNPDTSSNNNLLTEDSRSALRSRNTGLWRGKGLPEHSRLLDDVDLNFSTQNPISNATEKDGSISRRQPSTTTRDFKEQDSFWLSDHNSDDDDEEEEHPLTELQRLAHDVVDERRSSWESDIECFQTPESAKSEESTTTGHQRQESDGIIWPFIQPRGELLYEKTAFCLFMIVFVVKETAFALIVFIDALFCAFIVNPFISFAQILGFYKDRNHVYPMRMLRGRPIRGIYRFFALCILCSVVYLARNGLHFDNHSAISAGNIFNINDNATRTSPLLSSEGLRCDSAKYAADETLSNLETVRAAIERILPSFIPTIENRLSKHGAKLDLDPKQQEQLLQRILAENENLIQKIVQNQLETYLSRNNDQFVSKDDIDEILDEYNHYVSADKAGSVTESEDTQRADFALAIRGARYIPQYTSATFERQIRWPLTRWIRRLTSIGSTYQPPVLLALLPDNNAGQCWPMQGSNGTLGVQLSQSIYIDSITIEHVARGLAVNMSSAPKDVDVWGLQDIHIPAAGSARLPWMPGGESGNALYLGSFRYDIMKMKPAQTFTVDVRRTIPFKGVIFRFLNNWGNEDYTCIYRVKVHGKPLKGL